MWQGGIGENTAKEMSRVAGFPARWRGKNAEGTRWTGCGEGTSDVAAEEDTEVEAPLGGTQARSVFGPGTDLVMLQVTLPVQSPYTTNSSGSGGTLSLVNSFAGGNGTDAANWFQGSWDLDPRATGFDPERRKLPTMGGNWQGTTLGNSDLVLVTIPEPASVLLAGLGVLALLRRRR